MSGTVSFSMQQQWDLNGGLLVGGLVYSFASGTTTSQSAFRDASLTSPFSNPITLDGSARVPQLWFADGSVRIRITDATGVVQVDADAVPVLGSAAGGAPTAPTDPNAILQTGDFKLRYGIGTLAGHVRCNGLTIGNAGSGATERANVDCQNLFQYLWNLNNDDITAVVPSRGANAVDDFNGTGLSLTKKQITLPDLSGSLLCGLDDMGAGPRGWLQPGLWATQQQFASADPYTLGAFAGWDNTRVNARVVLDPGGSAWGSSVPNIASLPHMTLITIYMRL